MNKSYKWFLLALLSCAFFFHQADRALFGLLTERIQGELHLNDFDMGVIQWSLFFTLAVMNPIAGFLGDRFSRKWIITLSLIFWSLMTALTGSPLVTGMCGLVFFRSVATAGGESFYAPSAYALLASHHRETRSVAMAVHQAALYVGLIFSGKIVRWLIGWLDESQGVVNVFGTQGTWRLVFVIFGGLGLLLGIFFIFALRERPKDGGAEEKKTSNQSVTPLCEGLRAYFCNPSALLASGGFIAVVFANNAYMSWAPKFVARKYGVQDVVAGDDTMFWHYVFAFGAIMLGGLVTDALVKRMPRFRVALQSVALLLGAPLLMYFSVAPTYVLMITAIAGYGVFRGLFETNTHASLFDVVEPRYRSTAVGLMTMIAFLVGSLAPLLIGWLSKSASEAALVARGLGSAQIEVLLENPFAATAAPILEQVKMTAEQVLGLGVPGFEKGFLLMGATYVLGGILMLVSCLFTFRRNRVVE